MFRFDFALPLTWVRVTIALVWLIFGLAFKVANIVPRHRRIVARVLGERWAGPMTMLIALGEIGLSVWMLAGMLLPVCMFVQTAALAAMNALEIRYARDLLLSPRLMLLANAIFLAAGWWVALFA